MYDNDEVATLIIGSILTLVFAARWYISPFRLHRLQRRQAQSHFPLAVPPLCMALLVFVLVNFSDPLVSRNPVYIGLFVTVGGAWMLITMGLVSYLGISFRDDVLERHNRAAAVGLACAIFAATIVFAAANVGDGPTIWTTIGPAAGATIVMFALWFIHAKLTEHPDKIAIDRDPAAACRAGGFYICSAVVLGRAVAGDWVSTEGAVDDFVRQSWPALVLLVLAITLEKLVFDKMPRQRWREIRPSLIVSCIFIGLAILAAVFINPKLRVNQSPASRHAAIHTTTEMDDS